MTKPRSAAASKAARAKAKAADNAERVARIGGEPEGPSGPVTVESAGAARDGELVAATEGGQWKWTRAANVEPGDIIAFRAESVEAHDFRQVADTERDRHGLRFVWADGTKSAHLGFSTRLWLGKVSDEALADADPEPTGARPTGAEADAHRDAKAAAEADLLAGAELASIPQDELVKRAKAEHAKAAAAKKAGRKLPATPHADELERRSSAPRPAQKAASRTASARPRSTNQRYLASQERARSGEKRGAGVPISEPDLEAFIAAERAADPGLTRNQCEQISYWIGGYAVGIARFNKAWDRVVAAASAAA